MADRFNYTSVSGLYNLHHTYKESANSLWLLLENCIDDFEGHKGTDGKTRVEISTPIRRNGESILDWDGDLSTFPSSALVMSWYGIPELYREYWEGLADLVEGAPSGERLIQHTNEILQDYYMPTPYITDGTTGGSWFWVSVPGYHRWTYTEYEKGYGYPTATIPQSYVTTIDNNFGLYSRPPTPIWHGFKEDSYYPWLAYAELFSELISGTGTINIGSIYEYETSSYMYYCSFGYSTDYDVGRGDEESEDTFLYGQETLITYCEFQIRNTTSEDIHVSLRATMQITGAMNSSLLKVKRYAIRDHEGPPNMDPIPPSFEATDVTEGIYNGSLYIPAGSTNSIGIWCKVFVDSPEGNFPEISCTIEALDHLSSCTERTSYSAITNSFAMPHYP